jgi:hypothetical protein
MLSKSEHGSVSGVIAACLLVHSATVTVLV